MIPFDEAKKRCLASASEMDSEPVDLLESLGRILAEDVYSDADVPAFDKSAMDGFACRKSDMEQVLEVIETIPAGKIPEKTIGKNQCSRIMTGAMVPEGADTVIIIEKTEQLDERHIRLLPGAAPGNICYQGEDVRKGSLILASGTTIHPRHIGILASAGLARPRVYQKPSIALFVTGSELIEPGLIPGVSQIRNSNAYTILAQLKDHQLDAEYLGIVPDESTQTELSIRNALRKARVLIMSGAVSMGDFDFIPQILKEMGVELVFHGMQVKPGKRMLFGRWGEKYIFGLPGNPVSTFIQMKALVLPFLQAMMGSKPNHRFLWLPMDQTFVRRKTDKTEFIPGRISAAGKLERVPYNGSAHLHALGEADGLIEIPAGIQQIPAGQNVTFIPF